MGLDISSQSKLDYHASYSGLHCVRWFAYLHCGGKSDAMIFERGRTPDGQEGRYDWAFVVACVTFPNLMMHSDCDGSYTRNGRVNALDGNLKRGNSVQLLRELRLLRPTVDAHKDGDVRTDTYEMLLALVEDVVENHNGTLRFC